MHMIRWSLIFVFLTLSLMWLTVYWGWYDPTSWQYSIRVAGGIYFLLALAMSGIMSIPSVRRKSNRTPDERVDWSFIFIVVTIALFGISLWFD
ncbi:hypothetical protein SAMN04488112_11816 [Melghirimyces thermohalophilus]|uniref:Uncharacterized protein n=1 Tax=Melghirimyces thermohalophilus TaxID=1236220 RepID=A0A1G6PTM4_9BACL|nr:hypothetical protein [Melghirimyces thermohalophilus]SDC83014.1 hypothetical protein SAMN04488112_11816 [Melghirimyces thermohalophilus]